MEEEGFNLKRFLFGSITRRLSFAFGILIFLLVISSITTFYLNLQIEEQQIELKDIEAPLGLMVEQVIGYDAILTGSAHESLLHAEKGEMEILQEHLSRYNEYGIKLDNILKVKAKELLEKSKRSQEKKDEIYQYLYELDKVNIALVNLETKAFDAMQEGDTEKARSLIITEEYEEYKRKISELYTKWAEVETVISNKYRQQILDNSRVVRIYAIVLAGLLILISSLVIFYVIHYIADPIRKITNSTREVEKGNLKERIKIQTGDELEELGNTFNKTTEQLEKIDEERKGIDKAKTEFLSITSHELRSPMTPMQAQLQMLMQNYFGRLNKKQRESLDIVLRNTQRLDKIIQDFLEISRIEAARLKFNFVRVSLLGYIKSVIEEMKGFMPEKKINIELSSDNLPIFEVDPDRVMQVLRNLVNNAIKFSKDNGKITIRIESKKDLLLFSVKDNGFGIKKEDQIRIFEPFFQSGGMYQRKVGGTGLGLAICKGIVESQKGKIWFNSEEGKGTTFYFTIPHIPTKEMEPIKILFSQKKNIEKDLKEEMISFLGPLGEKEFEDLRQKGITEEIVINYINKINNGGILDKDKSEEFKRKMRLIFEGNKKEEEKLKKQKSSEEKVVLFFRGKTNEKK